MNIVLTGATGFIGKHLIKALQKVNHKVYAIVRLDSDISYLENNGVYYHIDNGNTKNLNLFFKNQRIEGVVHLASCFIAEHKPDDIERLMQSNLSFGTRVLEATMETGIKWFINTGSSWQNYNCLDDYSPVNLYAATKEAFQTIAKYYTSVSQLLFVTIKICDTYGTDDTRKKILNLWHEAIKSGNSLDMSPGYQKIDTVHIRDVVRAYLALIQLIEFSDNKELQNESFAVTSGNPVTLRELATIFEQVTSRRLKINWGKRDYRTREVMIPWTSGKTVPSWTPLVGLEEGIRDLINEQV
jgi:nucleoside-diphosphate-sugar epimerase